METKNRSARISLKGFSVSAILYHRVENGVEWGAQERMKVAQCRPKLVSHLENVFATIFLDTSRISLINFLHAGLAS